MERFRNHSGKPTKNLIPDTILNTYRYSYYFEDKSCTATRFLLILTVQKTATLTKFKLLLNFQMRDVHTNIQLNCYWYPPWKTGAIRQSRLLLLAPDFSKLFSGADSNEGRLPDGLATENCFFFCNTRTHWRSPLFALPGV